MACWTTLCNENKRQSSFPISCLSLLGKPTNSGQQTGSHAGRLGNQASARHSLAIQPTQGNKLGHMLANFPHFLLVSLLGKPTNSGQQTGSNAGKLGNRASANKIWHKNQHLAINWVTSWQFFLTSCPSLLGKPNSSGQPTGSHAGKLGNQASAITGWQTLLGCSLATVQGVTESVGG